MIKAIFIGYLIFISLFTFLLFGVDKHRAKRQQRRIPEFRLLLFSALGGSIGALSGVYFFRHKTLHLKFTWGLPFILILQIITAVYCFHSHELTLDYPRFISIFIP